MTFCKFASAVPTTFYLKKRPTTSNFNFTQMYSKKPQSAFFNLFSAIIKEINNFLNSPCQATIYSRLTIPLLGKYRLSVHCHCYYLYLCERDERIPNIHLGCIVVSVRHGKIIAIAFLSKTLGYDLFWCSVCFAFITMVITAYQLHFLIQFSEQYASLKFCCLDLSFVSGIFNSHSLHYLFWVGASTNCSHTSNFVSIYLFFPLL